MVHEARTPLAKNPYSASTRRHLWKYWTGDWYWISHAPTSPQTNIDSVLGLERSMWPALHAPTFNSRVDLSPVSSRPISLVPCGARMDGRPCVVANMEVHEPCHQQLYRHVLDGWMDGGLELNSRAQGVTDDEEMRWIWWLIPRDLQKCLIAYLMMRAIEYANNFVYLKLIQYLNTDIRPHNQWQHCRSSIYLFTNNV